MATPGIGGCAQYLYWDSWANSATWYICDLSKHGTMLPMGDIPLSSRAGSIWGQTKSVETVLCSQLVKHYTQVAVK